ncbi:MAG: o-succinylbenzoate synthase [Thermotogae bacterium]|nr:o-succinylbenzoate synthase [Thermotogota bacterium]
MEKITENATIDRLVLYEVKIPFKVPFRISKGVAYYRKSLIVEMREKDIVGFGESAPFEYPFYSSETTESAKYLLSSFFFPNIIGVEIQSIRHMNEFLNNSIVGNNFAKAALETAFWDLIAKKNNIPLKELLKIKMKELGVKSKYLESEDYIESGISIGIPENGDKRVFRNWIKDAIKAGYKRVKIKIKSGWDVEPLKITRDILGYDFPLWTDSNASYTLKQIDVFKKLDEFECLFHEQPLYVDNYLENLELSKYIKTPICLDESLKSYNIAKQVLKLGISKIWNLKIQRIGGLYEAIKIYKLATDNEVDLWGGTMPETGLGALFIMNIGSFKGFKYPSDVEPSKRWFEDGMDLVELEMSDGKIYIPNGPGIGVEPNFEIIKKYGKKVMELKVKKSTVREF